MPASTFVHIPRTGGTTIARALGLPVDKTQHKPLWAYERPERAWSIVRNPYERAVSLCAFLNRGRLINAGRVLEPVDFTVWLKSGRRDQYGQNPVLYPEANYAMPVWAPMVQFFAKPPSLEMAPVRLFRFEHLEDLWLDLCAYAGVPWRPYPAKNLNYTGAYGHWRHYYSDETRKIVADLYAADFEAFGYAINPG